MRIIKTIVLVVYNFIYVKKRSITITLANCCPMLFHKKKCPTFRSISQRDFYQQRLKMPAQKLATQNTAQIHSGLDRSLHTTISQWLPQTTNDWSTICATLLDKTIRALKNKNKTLFTVN